jgi:hypothetical protein
MEQVVDGEVASGMYDVNCAGGCRCEVEVEACGLAWR